MGGIGILAQWGPQELLSGKLFAEVGGKLFYQTLPWPRLLVTQTNSPKSPERLVKYMVDVAMGMHYLAERGLVHRVSQPSLSLFPS